MSQRGAKPALTAPKRHFRSTNKRHLTGPAGSGRAGTGRNPPSCQLGKKSGRVPHFDRTEPLAKPAKDRRRRSRASPRRACCFQSAASAVAALSSQNFASCFCARAIAAVRQRSAAAACCLGWASSISAFKRSNSGSYRAFARARCRLKCGVEKGKRSINIPTGHLGLSDDRNSYRQVKSAAEPTSESSKPLPLVGYLLQLPPAARGQIHALDRRH